VHSKFKFRAELLTSSLLERFVTGSYNNGAVALIFRNTSGPMQAAMTLAAKLKTVTDFAAFFLGQFAAIGAGFSSRTERLASVILISKASIRYSFAKSLRAALG
jgi:hypothetical protein